MDSISPSSIKCNETIQVKWKDENGKQQQIAAYVTESIGDDVSYNYQLLIHSSKFVELKPNSDEVKNIIFEQLNRLEEINVCLCEPKVHKKILIKGTIATQSTDYILNWIVREHHRMGGVDTPEVTMIHTADGPVPGTSNILLSTNSEKIQERVESTNHIRIGPCQYHSLIWHGPVQQCKNCYNLFHHYKNCARKTVCEHCGEEHNMNNCMVRNRREKACCVNCPRRDNNHRSTWLRCPTINKLKRPLKRLAETDRPHHPKRRDLEHME